MKKTFNKGFTLIELLVVIAIIGILASVILASLNTARAKGADAASKSDLSNARAQAELYYDNNNNSYNFVCGNGTTAGGIKDMITDAAAKSGAAFTAPGATTANPNTAQIATTTVCHDTATAWAASVPLKATANSYFCVDSTGASKTLTAPLGAVTNC